MKENLSIAIMNHIFSPKMLKYNLRTQTIFSEILETVPNMVYINYDFFALKVVQIVSLEIKNIKEPREF